MLKRPQKSTLAEMRAAGVRGADYRCSHWTVISGDRWLDDVKLSDLEPRGYQSCSRCGAAYLDV
jgi:hypothetical protein